ncbi:MAG TPA: hypothetical protein VFD92_10370 [Candidatus Binatia bacterium]|nr:hypothetical protein [Candidatus Binatia bacterium]
MNTTRKSWKKALAGAAAIVAVAVASAQAARAADFCVDYVAAGGTRTLVGKGFKAPSAGKCKPFTGFTTWQGLTRPLYGTACTASDGSHLHFGLSGVGGTNGVYYNVDLPLPLGAAGTINVFLADGSVQLAGSPTGGFCNPIVQPIP